jgi:hypothetical protein
MWFSCLYCSRKAEFPDAEPDGGWLIRRYAEAGEYHHVCPSCRAAMAPFSFLLGEDGRLHVDEKAMRCFSLCVNAEFCVLLDQYRPDCETPGLKQRCLHALYKHMDMLQDRLDGLEKARRPRKKQKPSGKPGRGGVDT